MTVGGPLETAEPVIDPAVLPDREDIARATGVVREFMPPSPVRRVSGMLAKCEFDNPTGSFKVRGALAALAAAKDAGVDAVVVASAGNHGAGVAYAGVRLGVHPTVVVPSDCPAVKLEKMRSLGADVVVSGHAGYDAAEVEARALASDRGVPFVSPYANRLVAAGNGGTLAAELLAQVPDARSIVVPVGGGGLLTGLLVALAAAAADVQVVAVQSEASPAFARSLADGVAYTRWQSAPTLAEGLEGGTGATGVALAMRNGVRAVTVTERAIAATMGAAWALDGVALEGSAAVTLAARSDAVVTALPEPVVYVLSGGNVDHQRLGGLAGEYDNCGTPDRDGETAT